MDQRLSPTLSQGFISVPKSIFQVLTPELVRSQNYVLVNQDQPVGSSDLTLLLDDNDVGSLCHAGTEKAAP